MTHAPKVSIIVPVYNAERYLKQCLDSLISQTVSDIEIICTDDGSTDDSANILSAYARKDPRCIALRQENAGPASARNTALRRAKAPYIMFCDADDIYEACMCEKMVAALESASDADFAVCAAQLHYESAAQTKRRDAKYYSLKYKGNVAVDDELLLRTDVSVWNKIFRRDIIERFGICFPEGVWYEDTAFFHLYGLCSHRAVYIAEPLYHYRRHKGSIMSHTFSGLSERAQDLLTVARGIYSFMKRNGMFPRREEYYCRLFFALLSSAQGFEKREDCKRDLLEAAADFAEETGLEFTRYPDLVFQYHLLIRLIPLGAARKRWGGLIKIKYKAHGTKYYFLGIPFRISSALPT